MWVSTAMDTCPLTCISEVKGVKHCKGIRGYKRGRIHIVERCHFKNVIVRVMSVLNS